MKTYLTYGFAMALGGLLLNLALFFLGFHTNVEKIGTGQLIGGIVGIAIAVACIVLGTQARRAEKPATEAFTYGSAVGAGVMTTLFGAIFGVITTYVYMHLINPGMADVLMQAQVAKWEAAGMSSAQIDGAQAMMSKMMHPALQACFGLIGGVVIGTLISLVTSAFLRRQAVDQPPAIA